MSQWKGKLRSRVVVESRGNVAVEVTLVARIETMMVAMWLRLRKASLV